MSLKYEPGIYEFVGVLELFVLAAVDAPPAENLY